MNAGSIISDCISAVLEYYEDKYRILRKGLEFEFYYKYPSGEEPSSHRKQHMEDDFIEEFDSVISLAENALKCPASSRTYREYFGSEEVYDDVMYVIDRIANAYGLHFTMPVIFEVRNA